MTVQASLNKVFREAESVGTWADYAVYVMGEARSGDPDLDEAIAQLYDVNETVHRIANQLALRHDVDFMESSRPT